MKTRTSRQDLAWHIGRQARIEKLELHDANVRLAYTLGWIRREQFENDLLDQCELGWRTQDELMNPEAYAE